MTQKNTDITSKLIIFSIELKISVFNIIRQGLYRLNNKGY